MAITWIHREIYAVGEFKKRVALQNTKQRVALTKELKVMTVRLLGGSGGSKGETETGIVWGLDLEQ